MKSLYATILSWFAVLLALLIALCYVVLELVQLIWGRTAVPFAPPPLLEGSAFTIISSPTAGMSFALGKASPEMCAAALCSNFPMTKAFMMGVALLMLLGSTGNVPLFILMM